MKFAILFLLVVSGWNYGRCAAAPNERLFNVHDYGAVADGVAMDTKPIQDAIDACHDEGGGTIRVPTGKYHIGNAGSPLFIRLGNRGRDYMKFRGQQYKADVEPEGVPVGSLKNVHISDVTANVVGDDKARQTGMMITGIPGHHVENVVLENVSISYPGGGTEADAEREVPEDIARYPEQFFFGVLPSWGAYIRHASNIQFKNVTMEKRSEDARERIVMVDVEGCSDQ